MGSRSDHPVPSPPLRRDLRSFGTQPGVSAGRRNVPINSQAVGLSNASQDENTVLPAHEVEGGPTGAAGLRRALVRAAGIEPARVAPTDFRTTSTFVAPAFGHDALQPVRGLDYPFALAVSDLRRRPSSLYTFPSSQERRAWLGIAI